MIQIIPKFNVGENQTFSNKNCNNINVYFRKNEMGDSPIMVQCLLIDKVSENNN